jgi:hypothetical protein
MSARWRRGRRVSTLLLASSLAFAAWAQGDGWSVQTVALRDLREAQTAVASLRKHGFPAFNEFTMNRGLQYVRVRVGCWTVREGAEAVAMLLVDGAYAREAVVVPHSAASPLPCTEVDVGFLTPATWTALHAEDELPTFRVELAGHVGHLRHDGDRWHVIQGDAEPDPVPLDPPAWSYRIDQVGGAAAVFQDTGGAPLLVCPGSMLGQVGDVVIVAWQEAVVACRPPASPSQP